MQLDLPLSAPARTEPQPPALADIMASGVAHHAAGRLSEAAACYSHALDVAPSFGEAWRLLGVIAIQTGNDVAARGLLVTAVHHAPGDAAAHSALGGLDEKAGALAAARAAYATALAIDPAFIAASAGAARVALRLGHPREAADVAEAALAHACGDGALLRALSAARFELHDFAGAIEASRAAIAVAPHADAYANLGAALVRAHQPEAAVAACEAALAHDRGHADAANTLGIARKALGEFTAALSAFERAIALGSEAAHINLGTTRLLLGDVDGGWPEYGWTTPERRANPIAGALPLWNGTPLDGRRLVIWPEQGIGDTVQMVRFLAQAQRLGGNVTLACPPGTRDLLVNVDGADALIDADAAAVHASADFDVWLPTIRLPVVFRATSASIPREPYLRADPARVAAFAPILACAGSDTLRVGLVWSGSPEFAWNDVRSCGLAALEPLREIAGVTFFALQQGAAGNEAARSRLPLVAINTHVRDFADTAAIVAGLDLVISVDTSVAHVVGAMGRPGWILLSQSPDWRWTLDGTATPWYPSLRLFRQRSKMSWEPVLADLAIALRELVERRRRPEKRSGRLLN